MQNLDDGNQRTPINWRAILIAVAICFVLGFMLGGLFGAVFFSIAMIAGSSALEAVDSPVVIGLGFAIGIIPVICGAIFLGRQIKERLQTHAFLFAMINAMISGLFMLIPSETGVTWTDIGYCIL